MNGDSEKADLIFISPDEVHCQLKKQISALIDVSDSSMLSGPADLFTAFQAFNIVVMAC